MRTIGILLTILLIILGIAFTALNAQSVELNYLLGSKQLPLAAVLLLSLTIGVVLTGFTLGFSLLKLKAKNKWLESKLKKTQDQLVHTQQ
ncbi:MAG: LapA family protein [Proteobacteria bacterium]|nr:LapA family protein [Pseudomonadota bacterium]